MPLRCPLQLSDAEALEMQNSCSTNSVLPPGRSPPVASSRSGTTFGIVIFVNGVKGHSARQLSRDLDCQYKTVRASLSSAKPLPRMKDRKVSADVEIDGAYFGGYVKPANNKENRRDRRLWKNQNGKRRCVVIMRERNGATLPYHVALRNYCCR